MAAASALCSTNAYLFPSSVSAARCSSISCSSKSALLPSPVNPCNFSSSLLPLLSIPKKKKITGVIPETFAASSSSVAEADSPEAVQVQIAAAEAEIPKGEDVFAVVMVGGRQYIVFPGRFIYTQRLKEANVNDKIILNKVLLVGTRTKAYIGQPVVTNATVHAVVEEQGLDKKVIVYKYKRKKNYRRNIGHRQPNTRIRITGISGYEDFPAETMPNT